MNAAAVHGAQVSHTAYAIAPRASPQVPFPPASTAAAIAPASHAPAASIASPSARPRPSSTAIAVASAQPVPRGVGPGTRGRVQWRATLRRDQHVVHERLGLVDVAALDQHGAEAVARDQEASRPLRPRRRSPRGRSPARRPRAALGVTSVARLSSGTISAGSPSHSDPPRDVASTGSTTTGPA